jgi:hypothetical protein
MYNLHLQGGGVSQTSNRRPQCGTLASLAVAPNTFVPYSNPKQNECPKCDASTKALRPTGSEEDD